MGQCQDGGLSGCVLRAGVRSGQLSIPEQSYIFKAICGLCMPAKLPGHHKMGKKLRFPPCISAEASPASCFSGPSTHPCNMRQTYQEEAVGAIPPANLEVMAAITPCQTALTSKIKAV